jgi:hypothetical protein
MPNVPNAPNGATKTEIVDRYFVISHPDGSMNAVANIDDVHFHLNASPFDGHSSHFNDQSQFSEEGLTIHNNTVGNLGSDLNHQHLGDHSRSSSDIGSFQSHYNVNDQGFNMVSIIHLAGSGADVSHLNYHS